MSFKKVYLIIGDYLLKEKASLLDLLEEVKGFSKSIGCSRMYFYLTKETNLENKLDDYFETKEEKPIIVLKRFTTLPVQLDNLSS